MSQEAIDKLLDSVDEPIKGYVSRNQPVKKVPINSPVKLKRNENGIVPRKRPDKDVTYVCEICAKVASKISILLPYPKRALDAVYCPRCKWTIEVNGR